MKEVTLGCEVTDKITGFKGTVIGIVRYLTGCDQALISPRTKDAREYPEASWLDINRLKVSSKNLVVLDTSKSRGACEEPPKR
jgi:hypothetical protein